MIINEHCLPNDYYKLIQATYSTEKDLFFNKFSVNARYVRFCNANTVSKVVGLGMIGSWVIKI